MKRKQILRYFKIVITSIIIIVVLNYTIGIIFLNFGTPFGLLISKYKLDKYSKAVYGEDIIPSGIPIYNIKSGDYHYKLITKDNKEVTVLQYNTYNHIIIDANLKADTDLPIQIKTINAKLEKDVYLPTPSIFCGVEGNQNFSQHPLKRSDKLYLLGIINTNVSLTSEQSKEKFFEIISFIYKNLDNKYNFTSSQIQYTDINGVMETYISSKESKLPYKKIKSKIKLITQGELEMDFINQLKAVKDGQLPKENLIIPIKY